MTKVEIISNFTAMKALLKHKLYDELDNVFNETLAAAKGEFGEFKNNSKLNETAKETWSEKENDTND